jgi:hypothetical protein
MPLSEYRIGGISHLQNTEMGEYATYRIQKWGNTPLSEYRIGGICHCQNTEFEE